MIRRRRINERSRMYLESWLVSNTEGIYRGNERIREIDVFKEIEAMKKLIKILEDKGLDVFKRGTKEPEKIKKALESITRDEYMQARESERVRSMFD